METKHESPVTRARNFVNRIIGTFTEPAECAAVLESSVSAEACGSFVFGERQYAAALVDRSLEVLTRRDMTGEAQVHSRSWFEWLRNLFSGEQALPRYVLAPGNKTRCETQFRTSEAGLAQQVFRTSYWLDSPEAQRDTAFTRLVLSPNFLSSAFSSDGKYVIFAGQQKHLLPYPAVIREQGGDRLIRKCGELLSTLSRGERDLAGEREAIVTKHLLETAMLESIVDHVNRTCVPELQCQV